MISVMALIQTATDLTEKHIETNAESMRACARTLSKDPILNRVVDRSQKGISYARGGQDLDAIAQFDFPDVSTSMTTANTGNFSLTLGLPGPLVADLQTILCLRNTVIAPPPPNSGLKRMSILRKRPDISSEEFQQQWFEFHSILVKRLPGIQGYRQNLVLDGPRDAGGHMMVDGMVELWFPDGDTIEAAFGSDIGTTLMTHAKEFISEISTFLVDPVTVPCGAT